MALFWLIIGLFAFIVVISAAWAGLRAAPWVPTWGKDFDRIRELSNIQPSDNVIELGAGEGRILKVFAKTGARSIIGYEISLVPFGIAWLRTRRLGPRVQVKMQDFFHVSFADANVIFCFLTPPAMRKLKVKFAAECRPGTRIISYAFSIPEWQVDRLDKPQPSAMAIYRYIIGNT